MKEYNLPYKSFIAGWFIDPTICNKLLKYFADNKASRFYPSRRAERIYLYSLFN